MIVILIFFWLGLSAQVNNGHHFVHQKGIVSSKTNLSIAVVEGYKLVTLNYRWDSPTVENKITALLQNSCNTIRPDKSKLNNELQKFIKGRFASIFRSNTEGPTKVRSERSTLQSTTTVTTTVFYDNSTDIEYIPSTTRPTSTPFNPFPKIQKVAIELERRNYVSVTKYDDVQSRVHISTIHPEHMQTNLLTANELDFHFNCSERNETNGNTGQINIFGPFHFNTVFLEINKFDTYGDLGGALTVLVWKGTGMQRETVRLDCLVLHLGHEFKYLGHASYKGGWPIEFLIVHCPDYGRNPPNRDDEILVSIRMALNNKSCSSFNPRKIFFGQISPDRHFRRKKRQLAAFAALIGGLGGGIFAEYEVNQNSIKAIEHEISVEHVHAMETDALLAKLNENTAVYAKHSMKALAELTQNMCINRATSFKVETEEYFNEIFNNFYDRVIEQILFSQTKTPILTTCFG